MPVILKKFVPQNVLSQNVLPQNVLSQNVISVIGTFGDCEVWSIETFYDVTFIMKCDGTFRVGKETLKFLFLLFLFYLSRFAKQFAKNLSGL